MTTKTDTSIRLDLFAVKEYDSSAELWCIVAMFRTREAASSKAREIRSNHSLGFNRLAKIVHPAQWVVDGFTAYGNTVQ